MTPITIPIIISAIESPDDRDFMTHVYQNYKYLMYSEIQKITNNSWNSEDLLQNVIVKLIDKIELLKQLDKPRLIRYIVAACHNTAYNFVIRESHFKFVDLTEVEDITICDINMEDIIISHENNTLILEAWKSLDSRSRYYLEAKYILEKTDQEIANNLNIKKDSVRMGLARARKNFKTKIFEVE